MKLSTRAQYGLRLLCQLALEHSKGPMQMGEISRREGISEKYLGQIIIALRSSGLVTSQRGFQGGYALARAPAAIRLSEVFAALEGEVLAAEDDAAAEAEAGGEERTKAAAAAFWTKLRGAMEATLASHTLEDIIDMHLLRNGYVDYRI